MSVISQLHSLIVTGNPYLNPVHTQTLSQHSIFNHLLNWWSSTSPRIRNNIFIATGLCLSGFYILAPSIFTSNSMVFSKRPDRFTTGFINFRNDCFANSSIQAISSLPGVIEYLNTFITAFNEFESLSISNNDRKEEEFAVPLHTALAKMLKELGETKLNTHTISVWTFLHVLEKIFHARISRSQHDAQELTQLIFETLENENLKFKKLLDSKDKHQGTFNDYCDINVPEFPFSGLTITQLTCVNCSNVSKPILASFLMLSLHTPETSQTKLTQMLLNNEREVIEGYHCLRCSLKHILETESELANTNQEYKSKIDAQESAIIEKLEELNYEQVAINEDIPEDVENYIKLYKKGNTDITKLRSKVIKNNSILKPPKELGIHLSRSIITAQGAVRNSCQVEFEDYLKIEIDSQYYETLVHLKSTDYHQVNSKILTTDENDVEDIDDNIEISQDSEPSSEDRDELEEQAETEVQLSGDGDSTSVSSLETIKDDSPVKEQGLSNIQEERLKESFKHFNLTKNNYKYRLKSIIKHYGSHTQGHYEVYKKKPIFVRDKEGNYLKLYPEIKLSDPEDQLTSKKSSRSSSEDFLTPDDDSQNNRLRRRLSSMVGRRRPSIIVSDPPILNSFELNSKNDGTTTPQEIEVDQKDFDLNWSTSSGNNEKVKLKKIPTVWKYPFWRISDSRVTEASKDDVLNEKQAVYMLFYERIDK